MNTKFAFTEHTTNIGKPVLNKEQGILTNVKILGLESKNGRTYRHKALVGAKGLYEGAKVNVNHTENDAPRDARDRFGKFGNIRVEEDGLYGDLHFLLHHPMAALVTEAAERMPDVLGFSHDAAGFGNKDSAGKLVIEEIVKVNSVDLVADPATNASLFESVIQEKEEESSEDGKEEDLKIEDLTLEEIKKSRPDLVEAFVKEQNDSEASKKLKEENEAQKRELDEYKAKEAMQKISSEIDEELKEAKLPEQLVTDTFKESLLKAKDADERKKLIEDRKEIAKGFKAKPTSKSTPESEAPSPDDDSGIEEFLESENYDKTIAALTGRMPNRQGG